MDKKESAAIQKAKNYAFLLLKFRSRSEKEISQRLKKKKFEAQAINATVAFLKEKNFLDDRAFARAWIDSRLKKPLGLRRIRQELKIKGIDNRIIDCQIGEVKEKYCEEAIVRGLAIKRMKISKGIDRQKAKGRVFSYLLRRGFSLDIVIEAVNQL